MKVVSHIQAQQTCSQTLTAPELPQKQCGNSMETGMRPAETGWKEKDLILGKVGGVIGSCFCSGLPSHHNKPFTLLPVSLHLFWTPSFAQENAIKTIPLKKGCLTTIPWQKSQFGKTCSLASSFLIISAQVGGWAKGKADLAAADGGFASLTLALITLSICWMIYCTIVSWVAAMGRVSSKTGGKVDCSVMGEDQPSNVLAAFKEVAAFMAVLFAEQRSCPSSYCRCFSFVNVTSYHWNPNHQCYALLG